MRVAKWGLKGLRRYPDLMLMLRLVAIVSRLRPLALLGAVAAALAALSGCGGNGALAGGGTVVRVSERDFRITAPKQVPSGDVVLQARNRGPDNHELIVVRAPEGKLPMRSDGLTVNEEALQKAEAGVLEPGDPGSVRELKLHLSRGRYVLFCNMSGHFLGGMHAVLVVK